MRRVVSLFLMLCLWGCGAPTPVQAPPAPKTVEAEKEELKHPPNEIASTPRSIPDFDGTPWVPSAETAAAVIDHKGKSRRPAGEMPLDILKWSEIVNGIRMRVEYAVPPSSAGDGTVYIRFENAGFRTIGIPLGNLETNSDIDENYFLRCHLRDNTTKDFGIHALKNSCDTKRGIGLFTTVLNPKDTTLIFFEYADKAPEGCRELSLHLKATPNPDNTKQWHGELATPKYSLRANYASYMADKIPLELPMFLPRVSTLLTSSDKESNSETPAVKLRNANRALEDILFLYRKKLVLTITETWLKDALKAPEPGMYSETTPDEGLCLSQHFTTGQILPLGDPQIRIYLASLALRFDSQQARTFLLRQLQVNPVHIETVQSIKDILVQQLAGECGPEWASTALLGLMYDNRIPLDDDRYKSNRPDFKESGQSPTIPFHIERSYPGQVPLSLELVRNGCAQARPFLISALGNNPVSMWHTRLLCDMKAPAGRRALVAQIKVLRNSEPLFCETLKCLSDEEVNGLGDVLRANTAFTCVLKNPVFRKDPQAQPVVRQIADTADAETESGRKRLVVALGALAAAGQEAALSRLLQIAEKSPAAYEPEKFRALAIEELGIVKDPRALPTLFKLVDQKESFSVISAAIRTLSAFSYSENLDFLVALLPADFTNWPMIASKVSPEFQTDQYRQRIARSLKTITGLDFGTDPEAWRSWWEKEKLALQPQ